MFEEDATEVRKTISKKSLKSARNVGLRAGQKMPSERRKEKSTKDLLDSAASFVRSDYGGRRPKVAIRADFAAYLKEKQVTALGGSELLDAFVDFAEQLVAEQLNAVKRRQGNATLDGPLHELRRRYVTP